MMLLWSTLFLAALVLGGRALLLGCPHFALHTTTSAVLGSPALTATELESSDSPVLNPAVTPWASVSFACTGI